MDNNFMFYTQLKMNYFFCIYVASISPIRKENLLELYVTVVYEHEKKNCNK